MTLPQFLVGTAIGSAAQEVVNTCLRQIGDVPASTNLGFVYITDALTREFSKIHQLLVETTGVTHWVGTTGIAICATNREFYDQPALVIMLASLPAENFLVMPNLTSEVDTFVAQHQQWLSQAGPVFGIVHGDPSNPATPTLIESLANALGDAFLVGGLTSSQAHHYQLADELTQGGISGVLFAQQVDVQVDHTQGCTPIGPIRQVTHCHRNIIGKIDAMTAVDALKQDAGEVLARDLSRMAGFIFAGLPIPNSDTGDYMVRNLIGIDTQHGLLAIGDMIETGDTLMFCRRDGNTARADMQAMLERLKKRYGAQKPKGGLYFSCLGRGRQQFGDDSEELKMISAALGDIPLVGFFANGEIYHSRLYGYTGVLSLFL